VKKEEGLLHSQRREYLKSTQLAMFIILTRYLVEAINPT
jgi:hypothetical protein